MNIQSQNISAKYFPKNFAKPYGILCEYIAKLKARRRECIFWLFKGNGFFFGGGGCGAATQSGSWPPHY